MTHSADYDAACDLAERRGCVLENPCWDECVEVALCDIQRGWDQGTRVIPPAGEQR